SVVAAVTGFAVACDGDDVAGRLDHLTDRVVVRVGDEQVARGVDGDGVGGVQHGCSCGPVVAAVTSFAVTGDGDDVAGRLDHLTDSVVETVGKEHVAGGVDGDAAGAVQLGGGRGAVVAAVTSFTVTCDGDDVAGRLDHLADHVIVKVGDEQVARGVDGDVAGVIQFGGGRGAVVAAVTGFAVACDGDDVAGRLDHLADHVIVKVGDEQVARGVDGHATGIVQLGGGGGSLVARVTGCAVAGGGHDRARDARGEVRGAAVGGRDGVRARRQARGRELRHAVDQRLAADRSVLVAEGDRPAVGSCPARRQVADRRGEGDRLSEGRRSGR